MTLIRKSKLIGNLGNGVFALCQPFSCTFKPAVDDVTMRRNTCGSLKLAGEVIGAQIDKGSHIFEPNIIGYIGFYEVNQAAQFPIRDSSPYSMLSIACRRKMRGKMH